MAGRIFILGAGASHFDTQNLDMPLPLATQFFWPEYIDEYWGIDLNLPKKKESALFKIIKHYFGVDVLKKSSKSRKPINVEEVFSFIEHAINVFPSRFYERRLLESAKHELLSYIDMVIRYTPWKVENPPLHTYIINDLCENDSIITFNWDLIVDKLLIETGDKAGLLDGQILLIDPNRYVAKKERKMLSNDNIHRQQSSLIKLHGSLNLVTCKNHLCEYSQIPYRFSIKEENLDMWTCICCGSPVEVMILPPHIHKTYAHNRFIQLQANVAAQKLATAQQIIIIGYSFPVFDFQASMLIRMARMEPWEIGDSELWLEQVTIVDKQVNDKFYRERVSNLLGVNQTEKNYGHKVKCEFFDDIEHFLSHQI